MSSDGKNAGEDGTLRCITFFLAGCGVLTLLWLSMFGRPRSAAIIFAVMLAVAGAVALLDRFRTPHPLAEDAPAAKRLRFPLAGRVLRYLLAGWGVLSVPTGLGMLFTEGCSIIRANESMATICLRNYTIAQITFSLGNQAAVPGNTSPGLGENAFADNFRNLHYGVAANGQKLYLISEYMADAFLVENALSEAPTRSEGAAKKAFPYQGYLFVEDMSGALPAGEYGTRCALMAIPAELGITGRYVYWIDQEGAVYRQKPAAAEGTAAAEDVFQLYRNVPGSTPLRKYAPGWEAVK